MSWMKGGIARAEDHLVVGTTVAAAGCAGDVCDCTPRVHNDSKLLRWGAKMQRGIEVPGGRWTKAHRCVSWAWRSRYPGVFSTAVRSTAAAHMAHITGISRAKIS
jgi:hypothetical protein